MVLSGYVPIVGWSLSHQLSHQLTGQLPSYPTHVRAAKRAAKRVPDVPGGCAWWLVCELVGGWVRGGSAGRFGCWLGGC